MEIFKQALDGLVNIALENNSVKDAIKDKVKRYIDVKSIKKFGNEIEVIFTPKGTSDQITVKIGDVKVADDNKTFTINKASSNVKWLENIINDFVLGKEYPIPEDKRTVAGFIKVLI